MNTEDIGVGDRGEEKLFFFLTGSQIRQKQEKERIKHNQQERKLHSTEENMSLCLMWKVGKFKAGFHKKGLDPKLMEVKDAAGRLIRDEYIRGLLM